MGHHVNIEKIDYKQIFMVREKTGYRFRYDGNSLKMKSPIGNLLFGLESYNKKEILNVEFRSDQDNETRNFVHHLKTLEKSYEQFSLDVFDKDLPFLTLPPGFIKEAKGKTFTNSIKDNGKNSTIVRMHTKNVNIYKKDKDGKQIPCTRDDVKGKKAIIDFELGNLWMYGANYGLLWYVTNIELLV